MRISTLIAKLQAVQREHGDVHIKARNRDGDAGPPVITDTSVWRSSGRPFTQWEVTTERSER